jgi:tRNA(fMet)-specific endonuclease VapC
MICLLDTDTLIYLVRGIRILVPQNQRQQGLAKAAQRILDRCRQHQDTGDEVGLSAITVAELEYGARQSDHYDREISAVRKILTPFATFAFEANACAEHYGAIRYALERAGRTIGAMDLLIAAQARALEATLVTNNTDHFSRVAGLTCENWTEL